MLSNAFVSESDKQRVRVAGAETASTENGHVHFAVLLLTVTGKGLSTILLAMGSKPVSWASRRANCGRCHSRRNADHGPRAEATDAAATTVAEAEIRLTALLESRSYPQTHCAPGSGEFTTLP